MMSAEENLARLGIVLPPAWRTPAGLNFRTAARSGNLLFLSGHGPTRPDGTAMTGRLGDTMTIEEGYEAARLTALNLLATIRVETGSLDRVRSIVKLLGMVCCTDEFRDMPRVVNGASDLFVEVFGESGRHARSAVGMRSLPMGIPVEIEMIVELQEEGLP